MAKKKKQEEEVELLSTKEVADIVSDAVGEEITPKTLRVHLRNSEIFGDQRSKRYGFEGEDDPKIEELIDYIKERRAAKKSEESEEGEDKKSKKKSKSKKKGKKGKKSKKVKDEDDEDEDE